MAVNFFPIINRESALPIYAEGIGIGHEQEPITLYSQESVHFHLTVSGCGIAVFDGKRQLLPIGTMMYTPIDKTVDIMPAPGGWKNNWVTITAAQFQSKPMLSLGSKCLLFHPKNTAEIIKIYETINNGLLTNTLEGRFNAAVASYRMLLTVISELEEDSGKHLADHLIVTDTINYISRHFAEKITMEQLCMVCHGISPQYLCRLFRADTGMRPTEYIRSKRIEYAKQLLTNSDMQIPDIAAACGFESTTYFYRSWKHIEKDSPANFRKKHKGIFV